MMTTKGNLLVAKRDVRQSTPSHVRGVRQGNNPGKSRRDSGIQFYEAAAFGSARRSTGICPEDREPIHPGSPSISPA